MNDLDAALARAADWLMQADGLLVTAGAGMGVDSGLPDFRGREGLWRAYPALGRARLDFSEIACPDSFVRSPRLAWGFYGHRLARYRSATPHAGFALLQTWAARMPQGLFVFTSNVDGQFQKAGVPPERVCEVHGSIHHLQCLEPCCERIHPADPLAVSIDAERCEWLGELPRCPACGRLARPNILMFGDWGWLAERTRAQQQALERWRRGVDKLVVLEIGAGTAIPTVRWFGEGLGQPLIRLNLREAEVGGGRAVGLPLAALAGLQALEQALQRHR
ncbi:MAG: hypothetical protein RIR00_387 [Pseudomonadota bacterium]